jgi:hypothetical protein
MWQLGLMNERKIEFLFDDFIKAKVRMIERGNFRVPSLVDETEMIAIAFGRLLGLGIIHEYNLLPLRLDHDFARLLLPSVRKKSQTWNEVAEVFAPLSMDQFLYIGWGLEDVLSHGGLDMYTEDEWMSFFAPDPHAVEV